MNVYDVAQKLDQFKILLNRQPPALQDCKQTLTELRLAMTKFGFKPPAEATANTEIDKELFLSREILELGAELSIKIQDEKAFERYVQQLKPYYFDYKNLPESERKYPILGLYLLFLLAENRIGEFHTELEIIPELNNRYIKFAVELEQDLMEGRYNKIWGAKDTVPLSAYEFFIEKLIATLREDMAGSLETSYRSLLVHDAQRLLMYDVKDLENFTNFIHTRNWTLDDKVIVFNKEEEKKPEIPAIALINQTLHYASELESII